MKNGNLYPGHVNIRKYFEYNTSFFGAGDIHSCIKPKSSKGYFFSGRLGGGLNSCVLQRQEDGKYKVISYGKDVEKYLPLVSNCAENEEYFINILDTCVDMQASIGFMVKLFSKAGQLFRVTLFPMVCTDSVYVIANITPISQSALSAEKEETVTLGTCVIGINENGMRVFKGVSPGLTRIFETSHISFEDVLYCGAVDECLSKRSLAECSLDIRFHDDTVKTFTVYSIPCYGENNSRFVLINLIPALKSEDTGEEKEINGITDREREVISLAANGCTNRYIAHKLIITEGTVKKTLHNAYKKLGIKSRVELIRLFNGR